MLFRVLPGLLQWTSRVVPAGPLSDRNVFTEDNLSLPGLLQRKPPGEPDGLTLELEATRYLRTGGRPLSPFHQKTIIPLSYSP